MEREEFCRRVIWQMKRATLREQDWVKAELMGHLEDHADALEQAGYDPEEARSRAVAAMGEPEEIGRALNAQLSVFWLLLSRISTVCIMLLCLGLVGSLSAGYRVFQNVQARVDPGSGLHGPGEGYVRQKVDVRGAAGSDILRVYWVDLSEEEALAEVHFCIYDENPFGRAANGTENSIRARAPDGTWNRYGGGGQGSDGAWYWRLSDIPVEPGQTSLALRYDRFGEHMPLTIPLEWEAAE
ncbi:permease prefix domain 1-containing protein [Candidatus Pseudoscillospira sp. SGI.172]|uniref:permease prefix domain 1-containing protein n=1 Tax=Candidatus Pseudoscillospira sp. SGI.172 TaxID=3420582 RepID=UPI003D089F70